MAMVKPKSWVTPRHTSRARTIRSVPTTVKTASSVYIFTLYALSSLRPVARPSVRRRPIHRQASVQPDASLRVSSSIPPPPMHTPAGDSTASKRGASCSSKRKRNSPMMRSAKRWPTLEDSETPKPSRYSEMKDAPRSPPLMVSSKAASSHTRQESQYCEGCRGMRLK